MLDFNKIKDAAQGYEKDMPTICHDMEGKRVEEFGFSVSDFE